MDLVTEYLKLGLRFDRVVDGFVDAYTGDPALKEQVAAEPAPDPIETQSQFQVLGDQIHWARLASTYSPYRRCLAA